VWLCVGMFSMYHVYIAASNSTTIEGWEKDRVATLVRRGKIREIKYPYNIGWYKNLQSVFGPNPLLWLWPQKMQGDGLSFPVNPDAGDPSVQYEWPPTDPTRLPNPRRPSPAARAFVYGDDGFNPALRPSNASLRAREGKGRNVGSDPAPEWNLTDDEGGGRGSQGSSSSPEQYLSDYDGEWTQNDREEVQRRRMNPHFARTRVREGSEGWEVRPVSAWDTPLVARGSEVDDDQHGRVGARPWEDAGRYNTYVPQADGDSSDEWG